MFQISHHCTNSHWWNHSRHCKHIFCQSLTVSRPCSLLLKLTHGCWNKTLSPKFTAKKWKSKFEVNIINFEPKFENMNIVIIIQPVTLSWRSMSLFCDLFTNRHYMILSSSRWWSRNWMGVSVWENVWKLIWRRGDLTKVKCIK